MAGTTGSSGGHSAGYNPAASAKALAQNKRASWIYACALGGLVGIFILAHFGRSLFQLQSRRGTLAKVLAAPFRYGISFVLLEVAISNFIMFTGRSVKYSFESSPRCHLEDIFFLSWYIVDSMLQSPFMMSDLWAAIHTHCLRRDVAGKHPFVI